MTDSIDLSTDSSDEGSQIFPTVNFSYSHKKFTESQSCFKKLLWIWKSGDIFFFENLDKLQNTDKPKSFLLRQDTILFDNSSVK
jgi:hypothetical protein